MKLDKRFLGPMYLQIFYETSDVFFFFFPLNVEHFQQEQNLILGGNMFLWI